MQALNASNEPFSLEFNESFGVQQGNLPMLNEKKTSEVIETSLIYLLSAAVAAGAFVLVGLIALLIGFNQA
jgi:hypothetical protein